MKIPASGELHGRAVEEWIGKTPDTPVPGYVQLRVLLRQNRKCAITKKKIRAADAKQCDHIKSLKNGGQNRESNLQIILVAPHREKTGQENSDGAKADRTALKHLGLWKRRGPKIQSRGFDKRRID